MKEAFIVEYGSFYNDYPWEIEGVFSSYDKAKEYVLSKDPHAPFPENNISSYHITPYVVDNGIEKASENKLTIKEVIGNMTDELSRTEELLFEMLTDERADDFVCVRCDTISELKNDINRTLTEELDYFNERIDLAMLMSAATSDIALPTINKLYKVEAKYSLPIMSNGFVDTEVVYNGIEDVVKKELTKA